MIKYNKQGKPWHIMFIVLCGKYINFFMLSNLINKHLLPLLVKTIVTFQIFYVCQKLSLKA